MNLRPKNILAHSSLKGCRGTIWREFMPYECDRPLVEGTIWCEVHIQDDIMSPAIRKLYEEANEKK